MALIHKKILLIIIIFTLSIAISVQANNQMKSREMLLYYFDLIQSGNYESANGLWDQATLDIVNRLGIKYDNIEMKQEVNAPIFQCADILKSELQNSLFTVTELESNFFRWKQMASLQSGKADYYYYTELINGYHWIVLPITHYARRWTESESKYFKFFVEPGIEKQTGPVVYKELDKYVDSIAAITGLPKDKLALLEQKKIFYYLCLDPKMVEVLSGQKAIGTYDRATDAVISSIPADFYNIAKFIINFAQPSPKPSTIPFMQDGYAAYLGGHWQRNGGVLYDFGNYLMNFDLLEIDSILLYQPRMIEGLIDLYVPAAASFVGFLNGKLDDTAFTALYDSLSNNLPKSNTIDIEKIKANISLALGEEWNNIPAEYKAYISKAKPLGDIYPGTTKAKKQLMENDYISLNYSDKYLAVTFHPDSLHPNCAILLGHDSELLNTTSTLYQLHFGFGKDNIGYRFGLMIDKNEIGLYDYTLSKIVGKFIDNTGQPTAYYDSTNGVVSAYIDLGLFDGYNIKKLEYKLIESSGI